MPRILVTVPWKRGEPNYEAFIWSLIRCEMVGEGFKYEELDKKDWKIDPTVKEVIEKVLDDEIVGTKVFKIMTTHKWIRTKSGRPYHLEHGFHDSIELAEEGSLDPTFSIPDEIIYHVKDGITFETNPCDKCSSIRMVMSVPLNDGGMKILDYCTKMDCEHVVTWMDKDDKASTP